MAVWAADEGLPDELVHNIKVVVSEAATNAVVHGYAGLVPADFTVAACIDGSFVEVVVRDHGRGMVARPDAAGVGLGLPLIANLADGMEVTRPGDGGTEVRVRFELGS